MAFVYVMYFNNKRLFILPNSWYIEDQIKKDKTKRDKLNALKTDLTNCAKKHNLSLDLRTKGMRERDKKVF